MALASTLMAFAGACGRVGFEPTTDGSVPPCAAFGSWSPPRLMTEVSTAQDDWSAALDPTGRVLVYDRGSNQDRDLYVATRPDPGMPFSAPRRLDATVTAETETGAGFSIDGAYLYYRNTVTGLYVMAHQGDGVFGPPQASGGFPTDSFTFSRDGLELFGNGYTTSVELEHFVRTDFLAPWQQDPAIAALNSVRNEGWPSFDSDRQTLYFERDSGARNQLVSVTRSGPGQPFGPFTFYPEFEATGSREADPEISRDGTTLIFSSDRSGGVGGNDLYEATRSCL